MEKPRRVLLYGKSVILGTLEASLKRYPQMEIIVLSAPFPTVEELKAMAPFNVVIFDTASSRPESTFALLETHPGLLLIGVDADRDEMLVLTSHLAQALSVADLVNIIHQKDFRHFQVLPGREPREEPPTMIFGAYLRERRCFELLQPNDYLLDIQLYPFANRMRQDRWKSI